MPTQSLKAKVVKGAVWTLLEKLSTQVVAFVVSMILARLLTPNDYGTVALTTIFFAVTGVLIDGGFGNALIQKKDADDLDFNSVFYLNVFLSGAAYLGLFLAAPLISDFYKTPALIAIVRVSAICLLFNAINAIQNVELTKKMLFHLSFRVSIITCLTSAICGVTLAIFGCGVWSLVWASLAAGFVGVIARWFIIAWRPRLMFSFARLKPLFSYGWKMAVSALLDQFFVHVNGLLIGRFYSKADLAYVNKGNALPQLAMNEVDATLGRVSFPALVLMQTDLNRLRAAMRRMIQCSTFLVFPLMLGIALCSQSLIRLLYGAQWLSAAPYMMLACFSFALWPFHTINLKGIMVLGRSDVFLKLEIAKKLLKLIVIIVSFRYGVFVFMAASAFALGPMCVVINAWPNKKLLGYTIGMQLRDILPSVMLCSVEAVVIMVVDYIFAMRFNEIDIPEGGIGLAVYLSCKLFLQLALGGVVYVTLSYAFKVQPMRDMLAIMSSLLSNRFPRSAQWLASRITRFDKSA